MDQTLVWALALATLAGISIPAGAALARWRTDFLSDWVETEARHAIMAFGAGALLAAVALVLIPEGTDRLSASPALVFFVLGGVGFAALDRVLARSKGKMAQFLAMMMDYVPEALALGAVISQDWSTAVLVAALICLQNLPESFNAMREMSESGRGPSLWLFAAMVPIGPAVAMIGVMLPENFEPMIGAIMMLSKTLSKKCKNHRS